MRCFCLLSIPFLLLAAADQPWQNKQISEWNDDDAHQVLNDSPWAKSVTPKVTRSSNTNQNGNGGVAQIGGVGIGMPGMGRRGGMRNPSNNTSDGNSTTSNTPPTLTVRWESAMPVQAAELKARNTNAPTADEDHYAIAVYGIPNRMINADSPAIDDELKNQAALKRDGKKDMKPSSVEVLPRDDATVVVYFFSRSKEITRQDKQIDFSAQIARLQLSVSFNLDSMTYQSKLQL